MERECGIHGILFFQLSCPRFATLFRAKLLSLAFYIKAN